jgi:RNA polymerase sigma factor (sigma-70 family)
VAQHLAESGCDPGGVRWDPQRERVLAEHEWTVRRFCASRLRDHCDAEDAAQDTLIRFLLYEGEIHNPEGWLINTARGICVDIARKNRTRTAEELKETVPAANSDPLEQVVHAHAVADILKSLQEPDRQLIGKLYLGGVSVDQMAALLHVSKGNVRIMAMRARRRAAVALTAASRAALGVLPLLWDRLRKRVLNLRNANANPDALMPAFNLAAAAAQVLIPATVASLLIATGASLPPAGPRVLGDQQVGAVRAVR